MSSQQEMEQAQLAASMELEQLVKDGKLEQAALGEIGAWWKRWYMQAGHKRLGRVVMLQAPKEGETADAPSHAG